MTTEPTFKRGSLAVFDGRCFAWSSKTVDVPEHVIFIDSEACVVLDVHWKLGYGHNSIAIVSTAAHGVLETYSMFLRVI